MRDVDAGRFSFYNKNTNMRTYPLKIKTIWLLLRFVKSQKTVFTGQHYNVLDKLSMGMHMFLESGLQAKNRVSQLQIQNLSDWVATVIHNCPGECSAERQHSKEALRPKVQPSVSERPLSPSTCSFFYLETHRLTESDTVCETPGCVAHIKRTGTISGSVCGEIATGRRWMIDIISTMAVAQYGV